MTSFCLFHFISLFCNGKNGDASTIFIFHGPLNIDNIIYFKMETTVYSLFQIMQVYTKKPTKNCEHIIFCYELICNAGLKKAPKITNTTVDWLIYTN